jgi:hypothetical protein
VPADAVGISMIGPESRFTAAYSVTWLASAPEVDEALRQRSTMLSKSPLITHAEHGHHHIDDFGG